MKRAPKLHIDFAQALQPPRRGGRAALLGLTCACVAVLFLWSRGQASLEEAQAQERAGAAFPLPARVDPVKRDASSAQGRATSIDAPWHDVLTAIESHSSPDATLLTMEPVARTGELQLTGEARDLNAMLSYVAELGQDQRLKDVTLLAHQVRLDAPGTPVRFRVQAHWGDRS